MAKHEWISEREAAAWLGYQPRTLRKKAKAGILDITFSSIDGRNYFYDQRSIDRLLAASAHLSTLVGGTNYSRFQWIPEDQAAARLRLKPRTFRKLVIGGSMNISYTNVNYRRYFYDNKGIERVLASRAIIAPDFD